MAFEWVIKTVEWIYIYILHLCTLFTPHLAKNKEEETIRVAPKMQGKASSDSIESTPIAKTQDPYIQ